MRAARRPVPVLLALAAAVVCRAAAAQTSLLDAPARASEETSISLHVGFAGLYAADRWTPLVVEVRGGRRAFNGLVVLDFQQDPTQKARIVAPFAATPDRAVPVPMVAAFPRMMERLRVTVRDERGRERARAEFSGTPRGGETLLRDPIPIAQGLVVSCGRVSLDEAPPVWREASKAESEYDPASGLRRDEQEPTPEQRLGSLAVARVEPPDLPRAWAAYDGVALLAVEAVAAAKADPRSVEAARQWVSAGGALVVLADAPGSEWRAWLPPGPAGEMFTLADPAGDEPPAEVAATLRAAGFEAAASVSGRRIRLTERGAARGWRLSWVAPGGPGEPEPAGYLAAGPVGHGLVVVATLDPARAPAVVSAEAAAALWREAARPVLDPWARSMGGRSERDQWRVADTDPRQWAINSVIDQVSGAPEFGMGVFLLLGLSAIGLALMLGPGDAVLLRRLNMRHRSWLTALLWIGLSSGVAYLLPLVWRTGPSRLGRFRVIDAIASPDGTAESAWQSGCTGLFASRAGAITLRGVGEASWWRGVSPLSWMFQRGSAVGSPLVSLQRPGRGAGSPIDRVDASIWTFRTLLDESLAPAPPVARIARRGQGWRVQVAGLGEGAVVQSAALRIGSSWAVLGAAEPAGGVAAWEAPEPASSPLSDWREPDFSTGAAQRGVVFYPGESDVGRGWRPAAGLSLPGADRRAAAVDWMLGSGRWGAVYLHVRGLPGDVNVDDAEQHHAAILRLLAPLEDAADGEGAGR